VAGNFLLRVRWTEGKDDLGQDRQE
jgi:hypothetical protein